MTAVVEPPYATREEVAAATDVKAPAYAGAQIDQDIAAASRTVEAVLHRKLYPWSGTRFFDFPKQGGTSWRVWFNQYALIQLDSVLNGDGSALAPGAVFLDPQDGPPYSSAQVDLSTMDAFTSGDTWQRALAFTGLWGDSNQQDPAGTLVGSIGTSDVSLTCSDSSLVGVGSLLTVGSERTLVTGKNLASTSATLTANIDVKKSTDLVGITGGAVHTGETITVGAERMRVVDVAGTNLIVERGVDGSTLAAHSTSDVVYAPRTLTAVRAATGTVAASASNGAALTVWRPPAALKQLAVALAVATYQQRTAGWTAQQAKASQTNLEELTTQTRQLYGRYRSGAA